MKLKNILLAVHDIERAKTFYKKMFGLDPVLEEYEDEIQYVDRLTELSWGQKMVRFYDPDGNLIEVRSPAAGGE